MATPNADSRPGVMADAGTAGAKLAVPPPRPNQSPVPTKTKNQNTHVSPAVLEAARKEGEDLLRSLRTSLGGLTQVEAEERARATGPNEVAQERKQSWVARILKIIRNPLVILLTILSVVSFLTGDARAGSVIVGMVALSVGLRFWQEARADTAAEKLKAMIHVTATVVRDGAAREIPLRDLVPGDIIRLAAGDMIPGDVRLLSSKDLFVSQGSLTGESLPVEKVQDPETKEESSPTELKNIKENSREPSDPRIRCPLCGWTPRKEDKWLCTCGHEWNTFDTGGVCPACLHQWTETQCLSCSRWSPHSDWYSK